MNDYTFEALCLSNAGPKVNTLAYLVGLVDSEAHLVRKPHAARYDILYPLSEAEEQFESPEELLGWQAKILPANYLPQTPVMFVRRWSPIVAMLEKGFEPASIARSTINAPHAVASGIWRPDVVDGAKPILDCVTDEELFWAIMSKVFERAKEKNWLVSIIAQVGWSYEEKIGSLQDWWSDDEVAQTGRVLWKCTVDG